MLDETASYEPFSPYSRSKALGEMAVLDRAGAVSFRPTSVHGSGRPVTRDLSRFLSSYAASVAGRGNRPTPQVLVDNVASAIAYVTTTDATPPLERLLIEAIDVRREAR